MRNITISTIIVLCLSSLTSCSQNNTVNEKNQEEVIQKVESTKKEPHRYGGWYCPDNLGGFPAVDIGKWKNVPVVNGRMPSKEETQNGTSLIFVDMEKYPNAKPLDMSMPKLAKYFNHSSNREELIIVIQAVNIDNDSIVGFRYLNGGNGSARLNEIQLLSDSEIEMIPESRFVSIVQLINAPREAIWEVLTKAENANSLQQIFDKKNELKADWRSTTNVNFNYPNSGKQTSSYAGRLYGNLYIQNDYDQSHYNEKFFLGINEATKLAELIIVCGPFSNDFDVQKGILEKWAKKVKVLSEKEK